MTEQATEKQIDLMKKLGIYQPNLTLREAGDKIGVQIDKINQDKADNIEREPIKINEGKYMKTPEEPKDVPLSEGNTKSDYEEDGFQIKSKQVRSNALTSAIEFVKVMGKNSKPFENMNMMDIAKHFEKYIRFGE